MAARKRRPKAPKLGRQPDGSYRFELTAINLLAFFQAARKCRISTADANRMLDEAEERYERRPDSGSKSSQKRVYSNRSSTCQSKR